jgi:hypothetical protein
MKRTFAAVTVAGFALLNAAGQGTETTTPHTNQPSPADLPKVIPTLSEREFESIVHFGTNTSSRVLERDFKVDGLLPRMARSKQPWQFLNPFAPPEYGTGFENLSVHPITHRDEGISFLTIHF